MPLLLLTLRAPEPATLQSWQVAWFSMRDPGPEQQVLMGYAALALCQGLPLPASLNLLELGQSERTRLQGRVPFEQQSTALQAALLLMSPAASAPAPVPAAAPSPAPSSRSPAGTAQATPASGASPAEVPAPPEDAPPGLIALYHKARINPAERPAYLQALAARGA